MTQSSPQPRRRPIRWLYAAGALALAAAAIWAVRNLWDNSPANQNIVTLCIGFPAFVLALGVGLSGQTRDERRAAWAIFLSSLLVACFLLDIEGVSGDLVPTFRWRWNAFRQRPASLPAAPAAPGEPISVVPAAHDYPRFLGRGGRAVLPDANLNPDWRAAPPRELWRRPIGEGWSSFCVVGDYAFTQEQRGDEELVACYRLADGQLVWSHADRARFAKTMSGNGPRATPTFAEDRLVSIGATGILNCLNPATGEPLWSQNVLEITGNDNLIWGVSCSPLVRDGRVYVTAGEPRSTDQPSPRGRSLLCFDLTTGALVWSANPQNASYASVGLVEVAGADQLTIVNARTVTGHDPATGRDLWSIPWPNDQPNVSQALDLGQGRLFLSAGYGVGCALWQIEPAAAAEFRAVEVWRSRSLRTKFSNVVARGNHVYGLDEGILACVDLATGKRAWRAGRAGYDQGQILLAGDLLLIQCESGEVALVRAAPDRHEELARFAPLTSKTWNNPVLAGNRLLVRNSQEAACFELSAASP